MDDVGSLRQQYREKLLQIRKVLSSQLSGEEIRETEDFDRDGVVFRTGSGLSSGFRAFISHEFLSDFSERELDGRMQRWNVAEKFRNLDAGFTLFVTTEGVFQERTSGHTLREVTDIFERVLPLSAKRSELYQRVFSVLVDDLPLGETPVEMQGDTDLYITYSEDFADALGAVYLLDAAGCRDFKLFRTPELHDSGIDFRIEFFNKVVFFDFKRIFNPVVRKENALREQINVGLRRAMRDATVKDSIEGFFIQVTIPNAPNNKTEVNGAVVEILAFAKSTNWRAFENNSLVAFSGDLFPLLSKLGARVYVAPGTTYLSVTEGARTGDRYAPNLDALDIISRETRKQFAVQPVWLGISLADVAAFYPFEEDLISQVLGGFDINASPFDDVIIGSANNAKILHKLLS